MNLVAFIISSLIFIECSAHQIPDLSLVSDTPLVVRRCSDFDVTGHGNNNQWNKTEWALLTQIDKGTGDLKTRFKILYSATGIYVLFNGVDEKITSPFTNDQEMLYMGDVFEVFFHPHPASGLYFEYEVSPLNKELVLLMSQKKGKFTRWMPWGEQDPRIIKKVSIPPTQMKTGSRIQEWSAEIFFPYEILNPMIDAAPASGDTWNGNFCRLDYDSGQMIKWSWSPIKSSFHEITRYRSFRFE